MGAFSLYFVRMSGTSPLISACLRPFGSAAKEAGDRGRLLVFGVRKPPSFQFSRIHDAARYGVVEHSFLGLTETAWFAIGAGLLHSFAGVIYVAGGRSAEAQESHTSIHALVCFIAGTAQTAMATGLGSISVGGQKSEARSFDIARYTDWSFTTPPLPFGLALTDMHERLSHAGLIVMLLGLGVLMIVTALCYGALPLDQMPSKLLWFVSSSVFFLGVYGIIWGPLRGHAQDRGPTVARVYTRRATILSVVCLYPVVLLIGSSGYQVIGAVPLVVAIIVLDVTAKGISDVVSVQGTKEILRERSEGREEHGRYPQGVAARARQGAGPDRA